jgi:hypothetical protein
MIHGSAKRVMTTLDFIALVPGMTFYLTGSRFFGTETAESDYDYFAEDSEDNRKLLSHNDFIVECETYVGDPIIAIVYKRDNVHVQLVKDVRAKRWIQDKLLPVFMNLKPDKVQARLLWRAAIALYRGGMHEQLCRTKKR